MMRHIYTLLLTLLCSCSALLAADGQDEVTVNNLTEFLYALKSNRVITIASDIEFGDQLQQLHAFNPRRLPEDSKYERERLAKASDRVFIYENTDGPELCLAGFKNLTIKSDYFCLLRIRPRYAYVLNFICCEGIRLEGLVMGHTDEGYCDGGVLSFDHCKDIQINHCDLYGCGTEGIGCVNTEKLTMKRSKIRDCSYQIMTLRDCKDMTFDDCFFFRNRQYSLLDIYTTENLLFRNCQFTHNEGTLFNLNQCENAVFEDCDIMHPVENRGDYGYAKFKGCRMYDEYGVKRQ